MIRIHAYLARLAMLPVFGSTCVAPCAFAQGGATRYPVTTAQVAAVLADHGYPKQGMSVRLAASITASAPAPQLRIQTASMIGPHEARLRMACNSAVQCLPFFAFATWPSAGQPLTVPAVDAASLGEGSAAVEKASPILRAGTPVLLQMKSDRINITIQVICLEGGNPGEKIRVVTRDRKQTYVGEIVSTTLLKGIL